MIDQLGTDAKSASSSYIFGGGTGPSHYELLDVPTNASRLQIREAYIRLKNTYATGSQALYSLVSDEEARSTMEKVEEAYRVLDDELARKDYDEKLGVKREARVQLSHEGHGEIVQTKARRTLNESEDDDEGPWAAQVSQEAQRPVSRISQAFTKIKKFATRAFDEDVLKKVESIAEQAKSFDGHSLVQLRESMGIQQSEMQERTKISIEYIKALENNDFQKLPSLVYVRGFLKIYLQYLGIQDGTVLVEAYTEKYNAWREANKPHSS